MNIKMIMEGAGVFQDEATKNIDPMIEQYSIDMRERQNVMLLREIFSLTWEALGFYLKYRGDAKELEELHNRPKEEKTKPKVDLDKYIPIEWIEKRIFENGLTGRADIVERYRWVLRAWNMLKIGWKEGGEAEDGK